MSKPQSHLANKYVIHTRVNDLIYNELQEYCNKHKTDFSIATREFLEKCLEDWRKSDPLTSPKTHQDYQLYAAYRTSQEDRSRLAMLSAISEVDEDLFYKLCNDRNVDPEYVIAISKGSGIGSRDQCRQFLKGLLFDRRMEKKQIVSVGILQGFTKDQVERSLSDVAHNDTLGRKSYWYI